MLTYSAAPVNEGAAADMGATGPDFTAATPFDAPLRDRQRRRLSSGGTMVGGTTMTDAAGAAPRSPASDSRSARTLRRSRMLSVTPSLAKACGGR